VQGQPHQVVEVGNGLVAMATLKCIYVEGKCAVPMVMSPFLLLLQSASSSRAQPTELVLPMPDKVCHIVELVLEQMLCMHLLSCAFLFLKLNII
jgi:hypothetical protein